MFLDRLSRYPDAGLLLLRLGLGISMIAHGVPKLAGGPATWQAVGRSLGNFGIHFAPQFWGFMAGFAETIGGGLLALGFLFRPALVFLLIPVMIVATMQHYKAGDAYGPKLSHPIELMVVFVSLLFIGAGRYSVDGRGGK